MSNFRYAKYNGGVNPNAIDDPNKKIDFTATEETSVIALISMVGRSTVVGMGHSRIRNSGPDYFATNYRMDKYGQLTTINELLGGRLKIIANIAVNGVSLASVLSNQIPQFNALSTAPKYVFMEIGYNDWAGGILAAPAITTYLTIYNAIRARGTILVAFTDQAGNTLNAAAQVQQQIFNSWLKQAPVSLSGLIVIDAYSATLGTIVDASVGKMFSTLTIDGIHNNCSGSYSVAREAFVVLDQIIPKCYPLSAAVGPFAQIIPNPHADTTTPGGNTTGTNGWTADTGITGVGPDNWCALRTGAGITAVTTMVARTASVLAPATSKPGNLLQIALTQGLTATDRIQVRPITFSDLITLRGWVASSTGWAGTRIRPTIKTGVQYIVNNTGASSGGADPTADWTTVIGTTFTDGAMSLTAVPTIDIGDTVSAAVEIFGGAVSGSYGAYIQVTFLTAGFALINSIIGGYFDSSAGGIPNFGAGAMLLQTPDFVIPPTTQYILPYITFGGLASSTWTVQIGDFMLMKSGQ